MSHNQAGHMGVMGTPEHKSHPATELAMAAIANLLGKEYKKRTLNQWEEAEVRDINSDLLRARLSDMNTESQERAKRTLKCLATGIPFDRYGI